ncbi:hypothetical protein FGB62_89g120 [Gracilaria domingensis]|nr:hypothetical protein FGB62_89g120 [Gracilaria domingensis]
MQTTLNASKKHVITSHQINTERVTDNKFNISATLFFDFLPGEVNYTITVSTQTSKGDSKIYTLDQVHSVYGLVFVSKLKDSLQIVSGDFGVGFNLTSFVDLDDDPFRIKSVVHIPDEIDPGFSLEVEGQTTNSNILKTEDVIMDEEGMLIMPRPFRTGSAMVIIKAENLESDGKSFETAIAINIPQTPTPPAIVNQKGVQKVEIGQNETVEVRLDMFNVRTDSNLTLLLGEMELPAVFEESVTNSFEQNILFRGVVHPGKYDVQVVLDSHSGKAELVSLYETSLVIVKEGENEKHGLSVVTILLIVFGCLTAVVLAAMLRITWINQLSMAHEREVRARCDCPACEARDEVQIVRDIYGRGSEQV